MRRPPAPAAALPIVTLVLLVAVSLAGCGGGGSSASGGERSPSAGASPSGSASASDAAEVFFARADSDAVNRVVARAQRSGTRATARQQTDRCNATSDRGYDAWRRCWHGLLDPFRRDLVAVGTQLGTMAGQDLPSACQAGLRQGQQRFTGYGDRIAGLLRGIDSAERSAQVRSMNTYDAVIRRLGRGFAPYFQRLTRVCYSPQELASIDAAAKASPSAPASP